MGQATIKSAVISKGEAKIHTIECSVEKGIGIHLVGLHDVAVKETLLRVITALQANCFHIPGKKIVINIQPWVSIGKAPELDLAIAIAILAASDQLNVEGLGRFIAIGELSLDGLVRYAPNGAQYASLLSGDSDDSLLLPSPSAIETIRNIGKSIHAVENLMQAIDVVQGSDCFLLWKSAALQMVIQGIRQWRAKNFSSMRVYRPADAIEIARPSFRSQCSSITAIYLDKFDRMIISESFQTYHIESVIEDRKRDIMNRAVLFGAHGITLVLKRSSGEDIKEWIKNCVEQAMPLKKDAHALQIHLLDIVLVADNYYYSFEDEVVKPLKA